MFALKDTLVEKGKYHSRHTKKKTVFEPQREKTTTTTKKTNKKKTCISDTNAQRRLESACICCLHEETLHPKCAQTRFLPDYANAQVGLNFSLDAHTRKYVFCHCGSLGLVCVLINIVIAESR